MKATAKTIGGSRQIDGNVLALKTAYTQGTEHKGVDTLLPCILFSYVFAFMCRFKAIPIKFPKQIFKKK